ncbi:MULTISPECIES: hypothetical protein, partial [Geobacillus]|uniref:hypothetical protein n=1 Tax=Geobacillus TaxID=129337 RepID=UPI0019D49D79
PVSPWFRYSAHLLGVAEASFLSSISPSSYLHNKTACRLCRQAETQPKGWVFRFPSISFNGIGLKSSLRAEMGDNIDGG